ncbi:MAG: histidinol-phosphatase family [Clostridiales bacterium]|nr:histidinol-phosphatase family [Clostridiales bacterium]
MGKGIWNDYHVHSSISPDAGTDMEKMCEEALNKGMKEIIFTDHYEFYSRGKKSPYFHKAYLDEYFIQLERCREIFCGKLLIKAGMEFGQSHLAAQRAECIARTYPFDYLIGSVHKLDNIDLEEMKYTRDCVGLIAEKYYENLLELACTGTFDCIGHFDLCKRHFTKHGFLEEPQKQEAMIRLILKEIILRGKGIEINTSGLRQSPKETMPGAFILKMYRDLGGYIITVGSDAHKPEDIGAGFDSAYSLLKEAGFHEIAVFSKRKYRMETI